MKNEQNTQNADVQAVIARQAAEWFVAHRDGPLAPRERAAFTEWLRTSPLHVSEYLAVAGLAQGFSMLADEGATRMDGLLERAQRESGSVVTLASPAQDERTPLRTARTSTHRRTRPRFSPRAGRWAMAAGLGALLFVATPWVAQQARTGAGKDFLSTAHGEQRVWRLPDGSVVRLNSGSELRARFSGTHRIVEVHRGQAMFDVARDPQRPFRVVAGDTEVVAIGTSFDVYRKTDATVVTVVTGKVAVYRNAGMVPVVSIGEVAPAGEATVSPATAASAALPRPLTAGEQVKLAHAGAAAAIDRVDLAKALAWTQQQIMFDQERLAEVVAEFNRYGHKPLEVHGEALNELRITGIFNAYDTESFIGFLGRLDNVEVTTTERSIQVRESSGT